MAFIRYGPTGFVCAENGVNAPMNVSSPEECYSYCATDQTGFYNYLPSSSAPNALRECTCVGATCTLLPNALAINKPFGAYQAGPRTFGPSQATYLDPTLPNNEFYGWTVSLEAVTTDAVLRDLMLYCRDANVPYDIQFWYTTANFTVALGAEVRNPNTIWVQATPSGSITGICPGDYAPITITGLNMPLTAGIKTGLSAVTSNNFLAYYNGVANDVRPITSMDGRVVLYYASGGADAGGSPVNIGFFVRTPVRELVINFPAV